ncbi:hypothetical protein H0H87_004476 [Tephrocybe sp. NHM501043]|nr:hypothetical protein H0H87_004476 [Tephrocybe sp. NHM501043]
MQLAFTFVLALSALRSIHCLTTGNFSHVAHDHSFGYTGTDGPLGWSRPTENPLCSTGKNQSPVNVDSTTTSVSKAKVALDISDTSSSFVDTGHSLRANMKGKLQFGDGSYELVQFHFHTPSEHRLNQEFSPLEMHMVFKSANAATATDPPKLVIGVLFEVAASATTDLLATLAKSIPTTQGEPGIKTGTLRFATIIKHIQEQGLNQYQGSLTTPPCTQDITWLVSAKTLDVDVSTFNAFKKVIKYNARYTQNTPGQQNLISFAKENYPIGTTP